MHEACFKPQKNSKIATFNFDRIWPTTGGGFHFEPLSISDHTLRCLRSTSTTSGDLPRWLVGEPLLVAFLRAISEGNSRSLRLIASRANLRCVLRFEMDPSESDDQQPTTDAPKGSYITQPAGKTKARSKPARPFFGFEMETPVPCLYLIQADFYMKRPIFPPLRVRSTEKKSQL